MRPPDDPEVAEWLEKADEDLTAARILLGSRETVHGAVSFHCQQAVEKALKAALVAAETRPPRTHDLVRLCEERAEIAALAVVTAAARALNAHSVLARYPGPRSPTRA
jgi:HEPN domain-containing protein